MALLETRGLTKEFGGLTALDDVDIDVEEGELVSLIGPNGAGKSTLINTITGRLDPTEGEIAYQGESIVGIEPHEVVQRGFEVVPDRFHLPRPHRQGERRNRGAGGRARRVRLRVPETSRQLPAVVNGERGPRLVGLLDRGTTRGRLAYGDKRRLEIAIVLATDPDMLLMDEPTAGMSPTRRNRPSTSSNASRMSSV